MFSRNNGHLISRGPQNLSVNNSYVRGDKVKEFHFNLYPRLTFRIVLDRSWVVGPSYCRSVHFSVIVKWCLGKSAENNQVCKIRLFRSQYLRYIMHRCNFGTLNILLANTSCALMIASFSCFSVSSRGRFPAKIAVWWNSAKLMPIDSESSGLLWLIYNESLIA